MAFTNEQLKRYSRHIILKEVGAKGQKKLLNAKVLIIGAGGLGSPVALYLAAAGVGTIGIADADDVDLSNLQRQVIHTTKDVGTPKVNRKENYGRNNPDVKVITYHTFVTSENILDLIKDYDFVIDGTDNFPAKFLINDACVMAKKPFSHAGIIRFQGQLMTYVPGKGHCYRCVFRNHLQRTLFPLVSKQELLVQWVELSEVFRQWKLSSIFLVRAICLQAISLHMMLLKWSSERLSFQAIQIIAQFVASTRLSQNLSTTNRRNVTVYIYD